MVLLLSSYIHEHTPVSIPVFMNTKMRIRIFTDRPGQEERDHAHLSNTRQLPSTGRSVIPRYSTATQKKAPICAKNHHFPVVHEQNADFAFRTASLAIRLMSAPLAERLV